MRRFLLFLLIVVVVVAIDARLRARVVPHLDPVVQPLHERTARSRLAEIHRRLTDRLASGQTMPPPGDLTPYLVRVAGRDSAAARDPWGNPYRLEVAGDVAHVVSSGRDGIPDTEHDIRSEPIPLRRR